MSLNYDQILDEASHEPSKEVEERVMEESESKPAHMSMRRLFKKFFRKKTIDKLRAFVEWVELKKLADPAKRGAQIKSIYSQIEGYQFYEDTALVIQQETAISCIAVNSNNQIGAAGFSNGALLLFQSKTGSVIKKEPAADEQKVNVW